MIERRRENTVVKQMGHASMAAWVVEQVTMGATDGSAHVTVLMREPLHQPVPWAEIPADPSLPGSFSRASASSVEEYHRARKT
jgi:hypothetical protein